MLHLQVIKREKSMVKTCAEILEEIRRSRTQPGRMRELRREHVLQDYWSTYGISALMNARFGAKALTGDEADLFDEKMHEDDVVKQPETSEKAK